MKFLIFWLVLYEFYEFLSLFYEFYELYFKMYLKGKFIKIQRIN